MAGIFVGDEAPIEIYVGDQPVVGVYVGEEQIWPVGGNPIAAKVGSFNTGTGTSNIPITDIGFVPKLILFWWNGRADTSDAVGGANSFMGFGAAVSPSSRFCVHNFVEDGQSTNDTDRGHSDAACVIKMDGSGAVDGALDLVSMDSDGFTVVPDDAFSLDMRVHYMAIGGSDIEAAIGVFAGIGSSGSQDITGLPFQPDGVIFASTLQTAAPPGINSSAQFDIAVADGSRQFAALRTSVNGDSGGDSGFFLSNDRITSFSNPAASFTSILSDGFRITWSVGTSLAARLHYVAIKCPNFYAGDIQTKTDGTDIVETAPGFEPVAAMFFTVGRTTYGSSTNTTSHFSIGAASSPSQRAAMAELVVEGGGSSQVATAVEHDAIYAKISTGDAIEGLMDLVSFDATGFTCVMDDADTSAVLVPYFAIG